MKFPIKFLKTSKNKYLQQSPPIENSIKIIKEINPKTFHFRKKIAKNQRNAKNITDSKNSSAPKMLFQKFLKMGDTFLNKFPLKKIVPIMKLNKNRNFMWITFFIIKFVKILKEKTFIAKFNRLNIDHFALINDNSKLPGYFNKFFKLKTLNTENFLIRKVKYIYFNIIFMINL